MVFVVGCPRSSRHDAQAPQSDIRWTGEKVTLKKKGQEVQDIVRQASCLSNLVVECAYAGDAKRAKVDGVDNSPRRRAGVVMNLGVGPFVSVLGYLASILVAWCRRGSTTCAAMRFPYWL